MCLSTFRHIAIMKLVNRKLFFIPLIAILFIIGVVYVGVDVRLKLKKIESSNAILEGLNHINKDLNLFIEDVTYIRKINTEEHLIFLREQQSANLIAEEELESIIEFFRRLKAINNCGKRR